MAYPTISSISILFLLSLSITQSTSTSITTESPPIPTPWPHQFHSILVMNYSGILELIDLWYDWPNGRNFNIIQDQLGKLVYDLEWNNGTSFVYRLDATKKCSTAQLPVGILRPNWLDGATYIGQRHVDGFLCNVWEKVEFITYYEDVVTKRPVHWLFYTGRAAHVMTFEVGAALEDAKWQAPVYCFEQSPEVNSPKLENGRDDHVFQRNILNRVSVG
ncbi:Transferring glycosyl group transferase [Thalictrum thalictroides]|uniref:Transferring glycosyl group transferase n=1 Tax=Thalictrum thalictroides TaxID=46969 RepID=A0A7J6XA13_THATH|nr:Transferring glycosyl group transferase [Thalictrum thalictroides]